MNNIETLAKGFAKANKISYAKALAFAQQIAEQSEGKKAGRPMSDEGARIREWLTEHKEELKAAAFTAKELAEKLATSPVNVNNALRSVDGFAVADKVIAGRGRPALVWKVA